MALQKSISTITLLSSAVAGIIGSGWLLGPFATAKIAGPAAILAWPIGWAMMMIIAATFVLLTREALITGGTVRFFQLTHGHFVGFGFSWIAWLAWVAVSPIEALALIQYSTNYFPSLMTHGHTPVLTASGLSVAIACTLLITLINNFGISVYSKINHVILAFKLCIPLLTVIFLLSTHFQINNFTQFGGFTPDGFHSIFAALPLAGVVYSFIGFNPAVQCAAESKDPRNGVPIAIFGALTICLILYTLLQIAFIAALPSHSLQNGWSALSFTGDKGPFAGLLAMFGFAWFVKALYLDASVSPLGTAMVQSMATSRLTYGMSENGYFPRWFLKVNRFGTPHRALLLNMLVGLLFFLPFPSWQHMVGFLVSCLVLGYIVGPMSLMVFARDRKLIHALCVVAFTVCNLMIYWSGWAIVSKIAILFVIGYIALAFNLFFNKKSKLIEELHLFRGLWIIAYLIGMTLISYLGSFGGNHDIPFGNDFIVIALFSASIYATAFYATRKTDNYFLSTRLSHTFYEVDGSASANDRAV